MSRIYIRAEPERFLRSLQWTPHEIARFQDRTRGVTRRLNDWLRSERGQRYADQEATAVVRCLSARWMAPP